MKIEDKVRVKRKKDMDVPLDYRGAEGVITRIGTGRAIGSTSQYWVQIKDVLGERWFWDDELELLKEGEKNNGNKENIR